MTKQWREEMVRVEANKWGVLFLFAVFLLRVGPKGFVRRALWNLWKQWGGLLPYRKYLEKSDL